MKRWIIFAVFPILLGYPALAGALDSTLDPGRSSPLNFLQLPFGGGTGSSTLNDKNSEGEQADKEKKQKEIRDKKVDDAIKKAWEEK